jgi:Glycosyltransferase like family
MIAFGCSVTSPEVYDRYARPGIRQAAEPDSGIYVHAAAGSVARSYNLVLDGATAHADLEAVVLVHQDAEITDPHFCRKLRAAFSDPMVGMVGCVGAVGAPTMAWWEGSVTWDAFVRCYPELDGTGMPELSWNGEMLPAHAPLGEVDTLDGFMMALSPWVASNLRFDESLDIVHGYDFDFCLQVRAIGRRVLAADIAVKHHHPLDLVTDPEAWSEAHMRVAAKWEGRTPYVRSPQVDWKQRARRAEAQAGAARLAGASKLLQANARAEKQERELAGVTETASWRITEPLRRLNAMRRRMLQRREEPTRAREGLKRAPSGEQLVRAERVRSVDGLESGRERVEDRPASRGRVSRISSRERL